MLRGIRDWLNSTGIANAPGHGQRICSLQKNSLSYRDLNRCGMFGEDEFNDLGRGGGGPSNGAPPRAPPSGRPSNIPANAPYPAINAIIRGTVKNLIPAGASKQTMVVFGST